MSPKALVVLFVRAFSIDQDLIVQGACANAEQKDGNCLTKLGYGIMYNMLTYGVDVLHHMYPSVYWVECLMAEQKEPAK